MCNSRQVYRLVGVIVLLASTAGVGHAQWGYSGFDGWYGGWGGGSYNTSREIHQQDRAAAQAYAASRNARVGSEVRGTLLNEANARTQASISQQQSARDWWFQTQDRQVAQQSARASSRSLPPLAYMPAGNMAVATVAPSDTPLITWPAVLADPRFAAARSSVEGAVRALRPRRGSGHGRRV